LLCVFSRRFNFGRVLRRWIRALLGSGDWAAFESDCFAYAERMVGRFQSGWEANAVNGLEWQRGDYRCSHRQAVRSQADNVRDECCSRAIQSGWPTRRNVWRSSTDLVKFGARRWGDTSLGCCDGGSGRSQSTLYSGSHGNPLESGFPNADRRRQGRFGSPVAIGTRRATARRTAAIGEDLLRLHHRRSGRCRASDVERACRGIWQLDVPNSKIFREVSCLARAIRCDTMPK
jgi:hypothetical protein